MSTIIAGRFAEQALAQDAVTALADAGFPPGSVAMFFVLPQGQHDMHGQGHDLDDSAGAEKAGTGAAAGAGAGATVGAAVGLAASPLLGPAGPIGGAAVGAYIGSLHGTLNKLDPGEQHAGGATDTAPPKHEAAPRRSGFVVAVETRSDADTPRAIEALEGAGTGEIERARGTIVDGKWDDFDPVAPPDLIVSPNPRGDPELPRLLDRNHSRR
jgi:phage tail tape-measure protein